MDPKQRAGDAALQFLRDNMVVGLGTGSTARFFIQALGNALRRGALRGIRGIATSVESERLAAESGIPVITFADAPRVDVTVDGADEIAPDLSLIKGLGGALLREKLVAQNSGQLIIIADSRKTVTKLGTTSALPVEVTVFGAEASERYLRELGCEPVLRKQANGERFLSDNGNYIFDCKFANGIDDPIALNRLLCDRAGIVESGLFLNLATLAVVADVDSIKILRP